MEDALSLITTTTGANTPVRGTKANIAGLGLLQCFPVPVVDEAGKRSKWE